MAVGRRPRRRLGANIAAGTGAILDDDGLRQEGLRRLRRKPPQRVAAAARGEGDDQADRPLRIGLRHSGHGQRAAEQGAAPHTG